MGSRAGDLGSVQRFVRLTDTSGRMFDSYPPNALDILEAVGQGIYGDLNTNYIAVGGDPTNINGILSPGMFDTGWYARTAYEIISDRSVRQEWGEKRMTVRDNDGNVLGIAKVSAPETVAVVDNAYVTLGLVTDESFVNFDNAGSKRNAIKALFGFGRKFGFNIPEYKHRKGAIFLYTFVPLIRGYKYGLSGLYGSRLDARFRRDRYGQFRDMLEQRRFPATLTGGSVEYPIEINFVPQDSTTGGSTAPSNTHSQNLDTHASSSMPYKDGEVVDRLDNPDITVTPVDVT